MTIPLCCTKKLCRHRQADITKLELGSAECEWALVHAGTKPTLRVPSSWHSEQSGEPTTKKMPEQGNALADVKKPELEPFGRVSHSQYAETPSLW